MNDDKIGALWENKTSKGQEYFSGQIEWKGEKIKIVAFKNNYKKEDRHPDWNIMISKPKEERQEQRRESSSSGPENFQDDIPWENKKPEPNLF
jgi:uncharacterized protein (DUF736 family)